MSSILKGLNKQQKSVIKSVGGHQLVIASAGSGKTLVLVRRVGALIERGVASDRILLLTFTRKAANEMKERALALVDERVEGIECNTFHGFALKVLRQFYKNVGLQKNFNILDTKDEVNLLDLLVKSAGIQSASANTIHNLYSLHINTGNSIKELCKGISSITYRDTEKIVELFEKQLEYKRTNNLMTFDDMLLYCLKALNDKFVLKVLANKYKYILVDEFQDTNYVQLQILKKLESIHHNILGTGDDAQSIYKFRGADYRNILSFPDVFTDCMIFKLEQNYRSTKPILDLANAVCSSFQHKFEKEMFTENNISGEIPKYYRVYSEEEQAQMVGEQIRKYINKGYSPHDCAVLYRANSSAEMIQAQLDAMNIPCKKEGDRSLFDKAHIRDLVAMMKAVYYPTDIVSWNRVLLLHNGVGAVSVKGLTELIVNKNLGLEALEKSNLKEKQKKILRPLFDLLKTAKEHKGPVNSINYLFDYYKYIMKVKYDKYEKREKDVTNLIKLAGKYKYCRQMLTDMTLNPEVEKETNGVVLSTIHGVKGLEFKNVWIINVTGKKFPSSYFCKTDEDIEEERRLFYVAITRAKEHLAIFSPLETDEIEQYMNLGRIIDSQESLFMTENEKIRNLVQTVYSPQLKMVATSALNKRLYDEYC